MNKQIYRKSLVYIAFVGPMLILFLLFIFLPFIRSIIYSFQDWNGINSHTHWVGWKNYRNVLTDTDFARTISFTLKYVLATVIGLNVLGLILAVALNVGLKSRNLLRTAFFLPTVMGTVIIGFIWNFIITRLFPQIGELTGIGILHSSWLALPKYAFWAIIIVTVWHTLGYYMIIYLAGLQGLSHELMEAAEIDGAGRIKRFWSIVLPLIRPSITICLFLSIINGFKSFDINYSLTMGGPYGTTESISYQIFQDAFSKDLFSYASAKAVIFFLILTLFSVVQVAILKRKEVEA
ncbi:ABC transporter permease [Gordoniibacillus kamchatkensis]|uniref:ABC transporter permease n=1 Tax=Gordoniibacillus kamchatkensis TaxID=1590651 RepID=A0ABR5AN79_9BACL|nr:sugar ABC transporter permease [Paenibacillus sp. VKM B-2647]KIL42480.1 ABC transporter permease [Paenibacillus sp. VKM B-2647]